MATTPRERAREQTMAEILTIGRAHLATEGAAALSLRAVARDLGVVSSAVYRYVKNRDELLTLLVVDGYQALGDAVDAAVDAVVVKKTDDFRAQFMALGWAVREWANAEPARYGLLFGSPVPGYEAPAEQTVQPGTRVVYRLVEIIEKAFIAGKIRATDQEQPLAPALAADVYRVRAELGLQSGDREILRGLTVWPALFGLVNFEVFGQYGTDTFTNSAALFDFQCGLLADNLGL